VPSFSLQVITEYSQFLEYHSKYLSNVAACSSTTKEQSQKPTALPTPVESFGMSHCLAASLACHTLETESNDPCLELECYLSDPLALPGTDIVDFWRVSFLHA